MTDEMMAVTIQLPASWADQFGGTPEAFARELRIAAAIDWFRQGRISQGRGAELAGLCRADFLDALFQAGVSFSQLSADEVLEEVENALAAHRRRLAIDPLGQSTPVATSAS